jgi:predicted restriction endonuclease
MNYLFSKIHNLIPRTRFYKNVLYQPSFLFATRPEQKKLRTFLINKKEHQCVICERKLPLCLLDAAHIKPRSIISSLERKNINNIEFMCKCCHSLFDKGLIGIYHGKIYIANEIINFNLVENENLLRKVYNNQNSKYFDFHYHNIFKK